VTLCAGPAVSLHPHDAAARGIADGDRVEVFNDRGRLAVEARLDYGVPPGCACISPPARSPAAA
jgi:biotin/methionine sulfoxide reductase